MVQDHANNHHHLQQQLAKYGGAGGNGNSIAGPGPGVSATGVARASRKNKPKKIPQRGLGVAQLEKLRIEEQKKMGGSGTATATPSSHALNGGGLCQLPTLHHLPPPAPPLSALSRPATDGGAHCGFRPVLWSPVDPMKQPYKRSLCPQPPLPMVTTGLSLTAPSSHPTEPPSNQMYRSSTSSMAALAPTEEEIRETAGVDRSWPFMFEGMAAFRSTSKALPPPPPVPTFAIRTASDSGLADASPDLSRYEFRATNYFSGSAYPNCSDWTSELAHRKDAGHGRDAALLTLSSRPPHLIKQPHVAPSMHSPEYRDFSASAMPSQASQNQAASSSSQPFYTFLPVGPVRGERAQSECKTDMPEGSVDLELKLWQG
ncbi:uncharacterized protein LOC124660287 [Lolium rigidum]|uniref:uncharacterized protein LOC124660287 n=1 Tax=Lolium rigidum TaxID=89674 RepID=UPI001F5DD3CB|nr:uncharacterized protein LOC124660287 [Lolium rigidum]